MTTDVWFVMLPGVLALDMTGPAETFSLAGEAFRLHYIGPDAEVPTSIGLTMGNIAPLPDSLPEGSLLVLPGVHQSARYFATPQADTVRHWLMRMQPLIHSQKVLLMCVCSGSLLAAKAGLMTGIQCTTHPLLKAVRRRRSIAHRRPGRNGRLGGRSNVTKPTGAVPYTQPAQPHHRSKRTTRSGGTLKI